MIPVIVPTSRPLPPPVRALVAEGEEVVEVVMQDDNHYGRLMTMQWQTRQGFIVVEHDVVPWPGAIRQLRECPEDWCSFEYPMPFSAWEPVRQGFCYSLGCTKFSTALVERHQPTPEWGGTCWDGLDGQVIGMLQTAGETCHLHSPPVAHLKAYVTTLRRGGGP
jgi:hypothetical protein